MHSMSNVPPGFGSGSTGGDDPFQGMPPIFGDMFRMMQQQGAAGWDVGRQFAVQTATGGEPEPNVDPLERIRLEQLSRVAELQVGRVTGLTPSRSGGAIEFVPSTRATWVQRTLDDYQALFDTLARSVDQAGPQDAAPAADDPYGWLQPLMKMVEPIMLRIAVGSMIGHLAQRAFGQYDLPIPRPGGDQILLVPANVSAFGDEWSLEPEDLRLWVCLHEVTHHAVLGLPHVRERITEQLQQHLAGFQSDTSMLEQQLDGLDPADPASIQRMFDPEAMLGSLQSPAQRELQPHIDALVTAIVGYVDHVMDEIGQGLIPSYTRVTEAMRRRRVEASSSDRFVERIFGLELSQKTYERGAAFVQGIVERAGAEGLAPLWRSARELPTPAEIEAPGLWLARIELPDD